MTDSEQAEIYRLETHRWKEANLALTKERDQLQLEIEADNVVIRETRKERDQLAAQVARLRDELKYVLHCLISSTWQTIHQGRIEGILSESPPEALRQLKREWIGPTAHLIPLWMNWLKSHSSLRKDMQDELARLTTILEKDSK
jgi:hypothetical protein